MDNDNLMRADPSALTTAQLVRELASLKELLTIRIDAIEKSQVVFQDNIQRVPTDVDRSISRLKELHDQKFGEVDQRFLERDVRVESTAALVSRAVDAALAAARESVNRQNESFALSIAKSETTTVKSIDALGITLQASASAMDSKIQDLKERMARLEAANVGIKIAQDHDVSAITTRQGANQNLIAILAMLIAAVAAAAALFYHPVVTAIPTSAPIVAR